MNYKTLAIVFICMFVSLLAFNIWSYYYVAAEEERTNVCWYDICGNYPEAYYLNNVCSCYDYGLLGELELVKEEYMKK